MRLCQLSISGWRNLQACSLSPGAGLNIVFGRNGQGKTNLLEAIYYVATLRSFRTTRPRQLVTWRQAGFAVEAAAEVAGRITRLSVRVDQQGRSLDVDGTGVSSVEEYFGGFNVVLFTPDHLGLVRGEPTGRRQFLDRALFNGDAAQLALVRRYQRILKERNRCLRDYAERPRVAESLLDAIDPQLSSVGAQLALRRRGLVEELEPRFTAIHHDIGGEKVAKLRYQARGLRSDDHPDSSKVPCEGKDAGGETFSEGEEGDVILQENAPVEDALENHCRRLAQALDRGRARDLQRGYTGVGPHQDDLAISLEGRSARVAASQGESRSLVLALKLAEVEYLHERRSESPVLLLDDLSSELDEERFQRLLGHILGLRCQTFLTTVLPDVSQRFDKKHLFLIDRGEIQSVS